MGGGGFRLDQGGQWGSLAVKAAWVSKRGVTQPWGFSIYVLICISWPGSARADSAEVQHTSRAFPSSLYGPSGHGENLRVQGGAGVGVGTGSPMRCDVETGSRGSCF